MNAISVEPIFGNINVSFFHCIGLTFSVSKVAVYIRITVDL